MGWIPSSLLFPLLPCSYFLPIYLPILSPSLSTTFYAMCFMCTIFETTIVVCMCFMCTPLFTRGSAAMLAKRNFSFIFVVAGFSARFRFEIGSVCSLSFFVGTIRSIFLLIGRRRFLCLEFVRVILFFFRTCERRFIKTKLSCVLIQIYIA